MIQQPKVEATAAPLLETARLFSASQRGAAQMVSVLEGNLEVSWDSFSPVRGIPFHHQGVYLSCIPLELLFLYVSSCLLIYIFLATKP